MIQPGRSRAQTEPISSIAIPTAGGSVASAAAAVVIIHLSMRARASNVGEIASIRRASLPSGRFRVFRGVASPHDEPDRCFAGLAAFGLVPGSDLTILGLDTGGIDFTTGVLVGFSFPSDLQRTDGLPEQTVPAHHLESRR